MVGIKSILGRGTRMNRDIEISDSTCVINYESFSELKRKPNIINWLRFETLKINK